MASSSFRSPSIVIFDIDDTILDVTQRYKDAVRAGYIDKERGAKRKKTFETPGKARKRAMEFLFSPDNLRKDRVVPGSIALINTLMEQGHTIVYVTARNAKYRDVTRTQLEDKGFPIFKDDTDMELLFFKPTVSETAEKYKLGVYAKLLSKYDVRMVFDDKAENLQMAASLGITGIYPTIRDYTKYQVKSNPHAFYSSIVDDKGYPKEDPDEEPYQSYRSHADESGMGRTGYSASNPPLNCGCGKTPCMTFGGLNNPGGIQSKVESILIKEGGAAGLKPLKAAFPKGTTKAQATSAIAKMSSVYQHPAGDYILKNPGHSENYMVPRDIHRLGKAADRLEETYEDGLDTPEWWKSKLSVTAKDADTLADSLDYVANNPAALPIMSGEPSGKHTKLGAVFSEVFIGRNVIKDVGEGIQSIYRGLIGGRTSMAERRMAMAVATMQKELSDRAKALGGNAIANLKVDYELPGAASITIIASADAIKMPRPPKKNPNYSIDEDFERMKKMAYDVRTREVAGEPINGREWWNQQSSWIEERYGTEPLDVTWAMPLNTEGFDPQDKSQEFDDNGVKPLHFLNQLKRIPMTKQPTPERIMQIALNIGQGQASGSVETDFTLDDFIIRQNPLPLMGLSVQVSDHRNAAGAFVMKGKKFLILQRSKKETSKHGLWELPGGKVEKGETMRETAIIETQEEAGLDVTLKVNLGSHIDHKKKKVYHAFIATPKKGQKVKLSFEHVAHKWVTPEEVRAMPKKKVSHHLMYFLDKEEETIRSNPFGLFKKKKEAPTPPKPKPVKPTPAIEKKLLAYNNALIEYNDEYEHNEGKSIEPLSIGQQFVFDREPMAGGEHIYMIYDEGAMNGMFAVLKQVGYKVSDINTGESVTWKEFMKDPRSDGDRFGRYLTATETEHHKLVGYLQYLADEGKINGRTVHYTYKDGTSAGWRFQFVFGEVKNNPRSNPPKNKIEKGKKLYEHMNGKAPEKIEKKKIDMGDVWYQVGEGGCWQIGYMSGKETGKTEQKYTHTFNEETKDGDFPKLYATMPENGKPMLIITGGTWKIRTDDKGVAWIYD